MTKYRIRLQSGRVIGPFIKTQVFDLKAKGHIQGNEEGQFFPTGDWLPLSQFDFYEDLMDENKTIVNSQLSQDGTFILDLGSLRAQKNEKEVAQIDVTSHHPVGNLTETVRFSTSTEKPKSKEPSVPKLDPRLSEIFDETSHPEKTLINPVAQEEIDKMKRAQAFEEEQERQEKERKKQEEVSRLRRTEEAKKLVVDESTQMIKLDSIQDDLLLDAAVEEKRVDKEIRDYKRQKFQEEGDDEENDEDTEKAKKKKKTKLIIGLAVLALLYAIIFPSEDKNKKPPFQHLPPQLVFPIPFDKSDVKRSQVEYEKGKELFETATYPNIVRAGIVLKSSYENNLDNELALNLLVRTYAEELGYSKKKREDAHTLFNIIQSKRPFLVKDPNGVIGLGLFYMAINKNEAAADVFSKYLKLYPKIVSQDLFAVYLKVLMKLGRIDIAQPFYTALSKAPQKTPYAYKALIEYDRLNQENVEAHEYCDDAIKNYPKLVAFYLIKADLLVRDKKLQEVEPYLMKVEELNLEYNDLNRAKYLEIKGLLLAFKGKVAEATGYLSASLKIEDSDDLRMKLADLASPKSDENQTATDKLISESKAIKQLILARDFFDKKNYELALSSAARATDFFPGHIPSELFLSKVQLKLGLVDQSLKTLEDLVKRYPDDPHINFALIDAYVETYKFNLAKNRISMISVTNMKNAPEFYSVNARLNIKMGDPLLAISWLRNAINLNPLNDNDIYLLADILIKRSNFDAARIMLNKCMELDPINPDYRIAYAKIVYEQRDDQAAIGYLLGLLDEFGEDPKILAEIAIFYYRAGKIKDFQAYKEKIEKLPNRDKTLYEFLIKAALLDERFDEIPGLVEKLLVIEPGSLENMMTAGKVMFETGKLVEAAKWFKRIQEKLDTYPKVQYYIAKIKFLNKDFDGAMNEVKKDLKSNGDNDADLVLMAEIFVEKNDLIEAENLFKKAQKINPHSYQALMGLADISTKRNNFDLALDLYKRAMGEKGDEAIIHKKIGDVYRLLGQGSLAIESYKLYLEMDPEAPDKKQIDSYIQLMQ